jgi:hypothetical protein
MVHLLLRLGNQVAGRCGYLVGNRRNSRTPACGPCALAARRRAETEGASATQVVDCPGDQHSLSGHLMITSQRSNLGPSHIPCRPGGSPPPWWVGTLTTPQDVGWRRPILTEVRLVLSPKRVELGGTSLRCFHA